MAAVTESTPSSYRLTEEQTLLRDAVRTLADERVAPRAADIDRTGEFPEDLRQLLAEQDILALPFPTEYGGLGGELLTVCLAVEQLSRACATTGLILAAHELGSLPLIGFGSDGAEGPLAAGPRERHASGRVRADRGGGRLRRRGRTDASGPRWRRLCDQRLEAVHHPWIGGRPHRCLRGHRC